MYMEVKALLAIFLKQFFVLQNKKNKKTCLVTKKKQNSFVFLKTENMVFSDNIFSGFQLFLLVFSRLF